MTKKQIQKEWNEIIKETHVKPKCGTPYPKQITLMKELLMFAQVLLGKIENSENKAFNSMIYKKTMSFYCDQMKSYV